jgi:putative transposase
MQNPTFTSLQPAYQLHFYLCFKAHSSRALFKEDRVRERIVEVVDDVCARQDYHVLETQVSSDHVRLLVSLKPDKSVSDVVMMLKGNLSRELGRQSPGDPAMGKTAWLARGYFARGSGKADIEVVRNYVATQVPHHGYRGEWTEALEYRNARFRSPAFQQNHCVTILNYHVVLVTQNRASVFDETIAPNLFNYIVAVGNRHGFAVERMSVLPDHLHLIVEAAPNQSIEKVVLALANNTAYWMGKHYWGVLKQTDAWEVWRPSYYAGTVGEFTTAQVKRFLAGGN